ncbi:MAG: DUF1697 domain-containing protein [Bacteroidales bacterium]|jgi:uncharacterized protein (DUF1697 family)|nr:DUF1697 domain-containing protein [Bacteroidales bacterium]
MVYVALLRGINVGGKNIVEMKKLKAVFESLGFKNVVTYINSGNIIFVSTPDNHEIISLEAAKAIKREFQLDIKVLVRDFRNMEIICNELPPEWVKNERMRTDIMFLWEKYDNRGVLDLLKINSVDNVRYTPGAVLWNVEWTDYSRSGLMKIMGTDLYRNMTIRNVNTFRRIYQIMSDVNGR